MYIRADGIYNLKHGPICLATDDPNPDGESAEDCLFLDVQAPSNATEASRLPVYFFIQGGGFSKNENANINATGLIEASDFSMVVVSFNYRVGPYGFITDGKKLSTNNGLRDQRKAMEWVQRHISTFGGNPNHVVLGGVSAGAASITLHLTANNGTNLNLFHGAAAESPSFATMLTVRESFYQFKQFATRLGCAGNDSLTCLQHKTAAEIQAENFNIPLPGAATSPKYQWLPVIDGDIVADYTYRAFQQGRFIKVPTIFGDDANDGTIFTPRNTSTLAQSNSFLLDQYPALTLAQLGEANRLYPNPNGTCPNIGCYWRQVSNCYGEARFMCPALFVTSEMAKHGVQQSYAYLWDVRDPEQVKEGLGVPHTVELKALLGPEYSDDPPKSYRVGGVNEKASPLIQAYWVSFIRTLDPNKLRGSAAASWSRWTDQTQPRLVFHTGGTASVERVSNALSRRCNFWASIAVRASQ